MEVHVQIIVDLGFGSIGDASMEITMETPIDVGGFQMDVTGTDLGAASGGLAADAGFTVSTGGTTMLGFSFSGGFIPAGSSGVLTNVEYTATASEACIINPVISDTAGGSVDVSTGDCVALDYQCADEDADGVCDDVDDCVGEYDECGVCNGDGIADGACDCDGNVEDCAGECGGDAVVDECGVCDGDGSTCQIIVDLGFGSIGDASMEITMNTYYDVGGFQMDVTGTDLGAASGGLAADAGFTVSTGGTTMLGFSFSGGFIPAGSSGVLTNVEYTATASEACIINPVISDTAGGSVDVSTGDCVALDYQCADEDADGVCDDVDDCVGEYDECGVCNGDGIADGACDCDGNVEDCAGECGGDAVVDECGVCDGDGSTCQIIVDLGFGSIGDASMEITMETPIDVGGFQMDVTGTDLGAASGGLAADAGFTVSTGGTTMLGFSFSGGFIPAGSSGVLTNVEYTATASEACIINPVISDTAGGSVDVSTGDCVALDYQCADEDADGVCDDVDDCVGEYDECGVCNGDGIADGACDCDGNVEDCAGECGGDAVVDECGVCDGDGSTCQIIVDLGFGSIGDASMEITMETPIDVGGFQMDVTGTDLGAASGGLAADAGFTVSTGGTTMLGFSFSGGFIPAGSSGVLTNVEYTATASEACIINPVISDTAGGSVDVSTGDCVALDYQCADEDADGVCDDVDDCVGEYDCAGNCNGDAVVDECGVCDGDGSTCADPVYLAFGSVTEGLMEITMETPIDVGGFQIDVTGTDLGAASGGLAADAGFTVSTGGTTMLGFSFSGGFIPAGSSGVLTNVEYTATGDEACLVNAIISDTVGQSANVITGDCVDLVFECADEDADGVCDDVDDCVGEYDECGVCNGDGTSCLPNLLSFGLYDNFTLEILYSSDTDIGGFQFNVSGVDILNTYGGAAEDAGFTVSSGNGTVLGFSFEGNTIPAGQGSLLKLEIEPTADQSCLSDIVMSDPSGVAIEFSAGDCIDLEYECADEDADGICDDVDDCVGEYDCAGNCNGDAVIDDCGVCDGNNEDQDCNGDCFGDAVVDECGVCSGDNSTCSGCTDESANNYDSDAIVDDGSCNFDYYYLTLEETGVSQAVIFSESISLDEGDEIGIFDSNALLSSDCSDQFGELLVGRGTWTGDQLNTVAISSINFCNFDDGYQLPGFVEGNPIVIRVWDASEGVEYDTVFDITAGSYDFEETSFVVVSDLQYAIFGCTDSLACNYDADANVDDGSCQFAEDNFNCDGDCIVDEDCFGECGGDAYVDECGDCVYPDESDCITEVSNQLDLSTGWNWISFNVYQDDMSLENVFSNTNNPDNYNFIKSQTDGTSTWYEGFGWFGSLEQIKNESMYQLKMNAPSGLEFTGTPVVASETPISLQTGWNWIGYLPQGETDIASAFANINNPDNLNFIKSQVDGTSTWYEGFGWFGSLETLSPTKGYQLKMNAADVLVYPDVDAIVSSDEENEVDVISYERNAIDLLGWDFNPHLYEFNGTVTFSVDNILGNSNDILAAFVGDELRGLANRLYFPFGDKYIYIMQVYSNEFEGEELTFKLYNSTTGEIDSYEESLIFENDMIIGDGFATFSLNDIESDVMIPVASRLANAYPNPFNPATTLDYDIAVDSNVSITVYDISGQVVEVLVDDYKFAGEYSITWNAQNYSSGVYFIGMESNGEYFTQKLMLVK